MSRVRRLGGMAVPYHVMALSKRDVRYGRGVRNGESLLFWSRDAEDCLFWGAVGIVCIIFVYYISVF